MYFALIPDEKTKADLAALVQDPPEEFHLTLLFSPDRETRIPPEEVEALLPGGSPPVAVVHGLDNFGPANKRNWALRLVRFEGVYSWLAPLRQRCEELLAKHNIPWDKTWLFDPHVTIGKKAGITLLGALPEALTFDRIELRY